ncbi:MAG: hypothetical protein JRI36_00440 [Deltaproteobacteria bacterium]|nr:hypothetical protein [Deltaproteobacteria bacterium]
MNKSFEQDADQALGALKEQVAKVVAAIRKDPSKRKRILIGYITHFYEGVKETVKKHGSMMPHYVIVADEPGFGGPAAVTDEVLAQAKALKAEAIMSVEGFESKEDLTDVVYHVTMSAPSIGVLGWVFKVKLGDGKAQIVAEKPYLFESEKEAKTLEELVRELDEMAEEPGQSDFVKP